MADGQAALLGHSKKVSMETKISMQTLASIRSIREQRGFAASALPALVHRINKIFLTQIFDVFVHPIDKHRKVLVARFLAALRESRRLEAARVIDRYRHLIDSDEYRD